MRRCINCEDGSHPKALTHTTPHIRNFLNLSDKGICYNCRLPVLQTLDNAVTLTCIICNVSGLIKTPVWWDKSKPGYGHCLKPGCKDHFEIAEMIENRFNGLLFNADIDLRQIKKLTELQAAQVLIIANEYQKVSSWKAKDRRLPAIKECVVCESQSIDTPLSEFRLERGGPIACVDHQSGVAKYISIWFKKINASVDLFKLWTYYCNYVDIGMIMDAVLNKKEFIIFEEYLLSSKGIAPLTESMDDEEILAIITAKPPHLIELSDISTSTKSVKGKKEKREDPISTSAVERLIS